MSCCPVKNDLHFNTGLASKLLGVHVLWYDWKV